MSSILTSGIAVSAIAGSIADLTFSRNQWGPYVKAKSSGPPAPIWLANQQAIIATVTGLWTSTLTDADRLMWIEASGFTKNKLTRKSALSGFQYFMRTNTNIYLTGSSPILTPPTLTSLFIINSLTLTNGFGFNPVAQYTPAVPANTSLLLYASPAQSAGRMTPSVPMRYIDKGVTTSIFLSFGLQYATVFTPPTPGEKMWIKMEAINQLTGQRSPTSFASLIF